MTPLRLATVFILGLLLIGCGWHLRGLDKGSRPDALDLVASNRFGPFEPLVLVTREVMQQNGIAISTDSPLRLHLGREELFRRTVAVTSIGSASQYELSLRVEYRYEQPGQQARLPQSLTATRVFDFDPSNTVSKNEEENTLLDEMRRELAIRLLNSVPADHGQN